MVDVSFDEDEDMYMCGSCGAEHVNESDAEECCEDEEDDDDEEDEDEE